MSAAAAGRYLADDGDDTVSMAYGSCLIRTSTGTQSLGAAWLNLDFSPVLMLLVAAAAQVLG